MEKNRLKNKSMALFLETGDSFTVWNRVGFLKREMALYNKLAKKLKKIYIFTYGSKKDKEYEKILEKNIEIIPKNSIFPDEIYELFIPLKYIGILSTCEIYKTNQNMAAVPATISKILFRNRLIIRSGYLRSTNAKLYKSSFYYRLYIFLVEFFSYLLCDRAFIPTKQNCMLVREKYPFIGKRLVMMNNFTDTDLFIKKNIPKKYDIIYVARLDKDKNHLELLRAIKGLGLTICFIGQGEEEKNILDFANKNKITLKMIKCIPNEELSKYYNSASMCVFPSLHEGNPKTLLEAMSCELPVIGCNVVGVKNLIGHGKNGLLCESNAKELRQNIVRLRKDKSLQIKISRNARKYIVENFSLDKLAKKEIKIYEELLP